VRTVQSTGNDIAENYLHQSSDPPVIENRIPTIRGHALTPSRALRETAAMECPINHERPTQYYGDYLGIERLLELQKPLSLKSDKLIAHDEMLFIIIHQAYELWFKQILHEITACKEVLSQPAADDNGPDMNLVVHRLKRVVEIWKLLNHQVDVLETMTPLDFLEFRELLHGASGFQSKQFRKIEASLGLKIENRFRPDYYKHTQFGGFNERTSPRSANLRSKHLSCNWSKTGSRGCRSSPKNSGAIGRRRLPNRKLAATRPSGPVTASSTNRVSPTATRRPTC
jgi:tryptophan 2,3-dioxygenase